MGAIGTGGIRVGLGLAFLASLLAPSLATGAPNDGDIRASASLDHIALYVSDLDRSAAFYKGLFGFREIPAPFPIARWFVIGNGVTLHIVEGRKAPSRLDKWDHFAVACRDMDAMVAALDKAGVAWSDINGKRQPQVRPDGVRQIFVRDPDGYWIEINDAARPG